MNRFKPVGWRNESYRHSLASRGILTSKKIDLKKYAGVWKQESVTPEPWFQKGCKDVKAKYELKPDGNMKVTNYCGNRKIVGEAVPLSKDNRKLAVSFGFPWFPGKYEIKKVDPDYKHATVTSGEYTWRLRKIK
jgi:lipocalin